MQNPVIPASGTCGFGQEMSEWFDLNCLGAIATKGTTRDARYGNALPRIAECPAGMLNAIGLQNPGVDEVIAIELPALRKLYRGPIIANVSGFSLEEYAYVSARIDRHQIVALRVVFHLIYTFEIRFIHVLTDRVAHIFPVFFVSP